MPQLSRSSGAAPVLPSAAPKAAGGGKAVVHKKLSKR
jgi:hypothetical protein